MNHQHFELWRNYRRLTSLVVCAVFVMTALPAFAKFKPRDRKPASGYSGVGGGRKCGYNDIPPMQLAPQTFVSQTSVTRPMLAWYMPIAKNVRFHFFEFDSDKTVKQIGPVKEISAIVGINQLKLPLDYPELKVGKKYLWQITIDCDTYSDTNGAEFIVVDPQSLAKYQSTSIPKSVNYYAENDLWYEALAEALKTTDHSKLGQTGATLVQELAQSEIVTGNEVEIKNIQRRIENLQKISSDMAIANQK
jgi:hypothetical protein